MKEQQESARDYYGVKELANMLAQRTDPRKVIQSIVDSLSGIERDAYGGVVHKTGYVWMNDRGISAFKGVLLGLITSHTALSNYPNEERVNTHMINTNRNIIKWIGKNRKRYEIKDKGVVLAMIEKPIYEQMTRAIGGFEADITGKSHHVQEMIDANKGGGFWNRGARDEGRGGQW